MEQLQPKIYTENDYYRLPEHVRAELIDGQFYDISAPNRAHQEIVHFLDKKTGNYIDSKNGFCKVYPAPFAVKLFSDSKTIVEPDVSIICDKSKLTAEGCTGAPDWVVEVVSPSNPNHDYIRKLNLYADAGVREYWIVNPQKQTIHIYFFEERPFDIKRYTFQDKVKVNIYDDLYINFLELDL